MTQKNSHAGTGAFEVERIADDIIECRLSGDITGEVVKNSMHATEKLARELREEGKKAKLLIDMHGLTSQDSQARSRAKALRNFGFEKIAVYGATKIVKTIGQYIARIAGMQRYTRFFNNKRQARRWLESKENHYRNSKLLTLSLLSIIVGLMGVAVLVGWLRDDHTLTAILPTLRAMNPVAALTFVLLSIGLLTLLHSKNRHIKKVVSILIAIWLLVYGAAVIIRFFTQLSIPIDTWLFSEKLLLLGASSNTAATTATVFACLGAMLLVMQTGIRRRWHVIAYRALASLVGVTIISILVGYSFGAAHLYNPANVPMPLNTVVTFLLAFTVCIGIAYTPKLFPIGTRIYHLYGRGLLIFTVVTALTGLALQQTNVSINQSKTAEAQQQFDKTTAAIEGRVASYVDALRGFKAFFESSGFVSPVEYNQYFTRSGLQKNYPGFNAISFIRAISPSEITALETEMRAQAAVYPPFKNFTVQPANGDKELYILTYLAPTNASSTTSFGANIGALGGRKTILEKARDTGQPTASDTVKFNVASGGTEEGFLITIPVYNSAAEQNSVANRQQNIYGFVNAVFRHKVIFNEIFKTTDNGPGTAFNISDTDTKKVVFQANSQFENADFSKPLMTRDINMAGQTWTVSMQTNSAFEQSDYTKNMPILVVVSGLVLAFLSAMLVVSLSRRREEALSLAASMTEDLNNERNEAEAIRQKDEAILASIGDAVFAIDQAERITLFNPAAVAISGYTEAEAIGQPYQDILPFVSEKTGRPTTAFVKSALRGQISSMEERTLLIRKDGSTVDVADSAAPIRDSEGTLLGAIVVFRDVSKERQLDQAKSEFVSLASHQLRTPLSAINWYGEMLLDEDAGKLSKDQREYVKEIYDGNQRMIELVDSLLNVSRLEVGKLKNDPRDVSMIELANSLQKEMQTSIASKKLTLTREAPAHLPNVFADPKLLRMIVQNLLSNAVKYTPNGGSVTFVMHKATPAEVDKAGLSHSQNYLFLSVQDTGYGIPTEQQPKIFEKLFRADNVRKMDVEGTGLGLYIVKQVAKKLGGTIWFESKESLGTTFYVVIPFKTKAS